MKQDTDDLCVRVYNQFTIVDQSGEGHETDAYGADLALSQGRGKLEPSTPEEYYRLTSTLQRERCRDAAPDLLAALEALVYDAEPIYSSKHHNNAWHKAQAAIAKAKGEA